MKKLISVLLATVIFLSLPFTADAAGTTRNPDNLINMIPVFHSNETGEYSSLNPWPGGELGDTVKEVMSLIRNDMSDFEKARIIYDWMTENVRYVNGRHSIANALVGRGATCMGYTLAYGYLLTHAGVEAISFYGAVTTNRASNAGHSWNLVKINGGWYHVDTTWGTAGQY
ncbi:MAG: hypothetical protein FWE74_10650, partial [Oscillospiraceae bacterium]|nr:hypothetical protein [Oscillospiraceae bacterium]